MVSLSRIISSGVGQMKMETASEKAECVKKIHLTIFLYNKTVREARFAVSAKVKIVVSGLTCQLKKSVSKLS